MGIKIWLRRRFIVPRVYAEVDKILGLTKGTAMNFLKGYATIIGAVGALLIAVKAFTEGEISSNALMLAISAVVTAIGARRAIANIGKAG